MRDGTVPTIQRTGAALNRSAHEDCQQYGMQPPSCHDKLRHDSTLQVLQLFAPLNPILSVAKG